MIGLLENGPHFGMEAVARTHQIKVVDGCPAVEECGTYIQAIVLLSFAREAQNGVKRYFERQCCRANPPKTWDIFSAFWQGVD